MTFKSIFKSAYFLSFLVLVVLSSYAFSDYANRVVSVSVSKMNVLYIGIDNPIVVAISDVPSDKTTVESDDLTIEFKEDGHYVLKARTPGKAILKIKAHGKVIKEEMFRVKRISDPVARLNHSKGGVITEGELKASLGIHAYIENFDINANCKITSYEVTRIRENADPMYSNNTGGKFGNVTQGIINDAKTGDTFYFEDIKCKCPGDKASRRINALVFQIR